MKSLADRWVERQHDEAFFRRISLMADGYEVGGPRGERIIGRLDGWVAVFREDACAGELVGR